MPEFDRLSRSFRGAALVGTCALVLSVPRLADACGAPEPGLIETVPVDGASYPANAALLFSGFDLTLDAVTVTVDGQPATLVPAEFAAGMADLAVLVEPAPQAGQTVVVSGSFCEGSEPCGPVALTYTASAPDLSAPEPVAEAALFAVYDHPQFEWATGCDQLQVERTIYVHLQQKAPAAGEALPLFRTSWDPDADGPAGIHRLVRAPAESLTFAVAVLPETLGAADPRTDVCLEIVAVDSAGNEAPPFQVCPPCFFREDEVPVEGASLPPEPDWTEADAVPGSACAPATATTGDTDTGEPTGGETGEAPTSGATGEPTGGETDATTDGTDSATGGEDGPDKGCACDSEGAGGPGGLLLLALAAGLVRRRR